MPRPWQVAGIAAALFGIVTGSALWLNGTAHSSRAHDRIVVITITVHHSHFQPAEVAVEAGSTVRFVLRNTDPIDHEFILGDEAVQELHEKGTGAHHDAPGQVSVPAGTERTTTVTLNWTGAGRLEYACHLPGHYAYGMRGVVVVRPG
ncbi:MAG TPA: cupredoxin domain-containing protein [Actinomycetota bacterium]|nr:cupredoxin domain-containing protein [Actinomycetota bacterium]